MYDEVFVCVKKNVDAFVRNVKRSDNKLTLSLHKKEQYAGDVNTVACER